MVNLFNSKIKLLIILEINELDSSKNKNNLRNSKLVPIPIKNKSDQ
jgi:hypothetical protein